jgi:hypothetical protein
MVSGESGLAAQPPVAPPVSVAVPDPSVLAALRRELEAKTAALQAAVASGGPRAAAAAVAAAPDTPPALLTRLLGLRNGEARARAARRAAPRRDPKP